jgi:hypothetical protein
VSIGKLDIIAAVEAGLSVELGTPETLRQEFRAGVEKDLIRVA